MKKEYKLTISLLASNRKDTLPKCLHSLKPLLEGVSSELIVTDTGCDEDLLEIIRTYTDKIVKFTWCNDFAKARNVGLKMALGEWFMFIDDDEWFENVHEIVDFFNSGEDEGYTSASYLVRNYTSMSGDKWREGVVGRIFRVSDNLRFEGKIHEHIRITEGANKQFFSYVHHYGYVFGSEEEKLAHYERNTRLLMKQIEENPTEARYYAHLYQEFRSGKEYDKSWEYTLMALENVNTGDDFNLGPMCSTYVNAVWVLMAQNKYEEAIAFGESFLGDRPLTGLARASISGSLAEAYARCNEYTRCMECADEYLNLLVKYTDNKEYYYAELGPMLKDTFDDLRVEVVISSGLKAAIETGNVKKAYEYILSYNWSHSVRMIEPECIGKLADLAIDSGMTEKSVRVFGKIFTNLDCSNILLARIREIKDENPKGYVYLCHIMAQIAGQAGYNYLVNIISAYKRNDTGQLKELYKMVVNCERNILSMEKEFFEIAIEKNILLGEMILELDISLWQEALDLWSAKVRNKDIVVIKKYMDKLMPKASLHMELFDKKIIRILESRKKQHV